jgi:hypothetical protein
MNLIRSSHSREKIIYNNNTKIPNVDSIVCGGSHVFEVINAIHMAEAIEIHV